MFYYRSVHQLRQTFLLALISNTKQMDIHLIYFDDESKRLKMLYIGTQFMGTATAKETLETFEELHGKLDDAHNMIQTLMDTSNFS